MITIEEVEKDIKANLSDFRYQHSVRVMRRMEELAKRYNVNEQEAKLVAISHDIGKEMTKEESLMYAKENDIITDEVEQLNPSLLHGKIGADLVKKKYDFTNHMQNAIQYHTTGDPKMDLLAKLLYVADKTEEGRKQQGFDIEYELNLANQDIDQAICYLIDQEIKALVEENKLIHQKSIETRNILLMKIKK